MLSDSDLYSTLNPDLCIPVFHPYPSPSISHSSTLPPTTLSHPTISYLQPSSTLPLIKKIDQRYFRAIHFKMVFWHRCFFRAFFIIYFFTWISWSRNFRMLPLSTLSSPSIRHLQTALLPLYSCLTLLYPITLNHIPESYAFPPSTTSLNPILFHPQPHPWILAFPILNPTFKPFSLFYLAPFNPNPHFLFPPPHPKPPSALSPRPVCSKHPPPYSHPPTCAPFASTLSPEITTPSFTSNSPLPLNPIPFVYPPFWTHFHPYPLILLPLTLNP